MREQLNIEFEAAVQIAVRSDEEFQAAIKKQFGNDAKSWAINKTFYNAATRAAFENKKDAYIKIHYIDEKLRRTASI